MHAITVPSYRRPKSQQNSRLSSLIKKYCNFENVNFDEVADGNVRVTDGAAYVPSYLAANMACPGDVDILYSTHSRLSVDVTLTGNRDGMFEPQNRAANIHGVMRIYRRHFSSHTADDKNFAGRKPGTGNIQRHPA